MKKRTKGILICVLVAAVLEAALLLAARQPSNGPNMFTLCVVPFIILTSAFTGTFGEVVFYLSIFFFFFGVTILGYWLWTQITKGNHDA
jgi:hypothetical protein